MLEFGISWSSFLFLFLASWPILSSQWLMKRRSLSFRGPDQASWMAASGFVHVFFCFGQSTNWHVFQQDEDLCTTWNILPVQTRSSPLRPTRLGRRQLGKISRGELPPQPSYQSNGKPAIHERRHPKRHAPLQRSQGRPPPLNGASFLFLQDHSRFPPYRSNDHHWHLLSIDGLQGSIRGGDREHSLYGGFLRNSSLD